VHRARKFSLIDVRGLRARGGGGGGYVDGYVVIARAMSIFLPSFETAVSLAGSPLPCPLSPPPAAVDLRGDLGSTAC